MESVQSQTIEERRRKAYLQALEHFQRGPDWATFYREILGVHGVIDQLFPSFAKRCEFEKTEEYVQIQQMLAKLRERSRGQKQPEEPTRVITVRLPQSLHEALRHEAHNHKTSMNKLCISKLLQVVEDELVPSDFHRHGDGDGRDTGSPPPAVPPTQVVHPVNEPYPTRPSESAAGGFHRPASAPPRPHFRTPPSTGGSSF
jgi:predicted HicB family RNase H-like nuclease